MSAGILAWQNENGLQHYPLVKDTIVKDFIVDASFIQFDNFIPILHSIEVKANKILVTILFDLESVTVEIQRYTAKR
jgi:hypothetical protein